MEGNWEEYIEMRQKQRCRGDQIHRVGEDPFGPDRGPLSRIRESDATFDETRNKYGMANNDGQENGDEKKNGNGNGNGMEKVKPVEWPGVPLCASGTPPLSARYRRQRTRCCAVGHIVRPIRLGCRKFEAEGEQ